MLRHVHEYGREYMIEASEKQKSRREVMIIGPNIRAIRLVTVFSY